MNNKNLSGVAPQNAKIRKKVDATRKKRFPKGDKKKGTILCRTVPFHFSVVWY